jgi:putative membrane protein
MDTVRPFNAAGGVSLLLPLVIAHEISRSLYASRRKGALEVIGSSDPVVARTRSISSMLVAHPAGLVGPAGVNAMQGLIQAMVDQMGAMERVRERPSLCPTKVAD